MHYLIPHFILTRLMGILADSKNQYIKKFLNRWWELGELLQLEYKYWHEQTIINIMLFELNEFGIKDKTEIYPVDTFNSQYRAENTHDDKQFVMHMMASTKKERIEQFSKWMLKIGITLDNKPTQPFDPYNLGEPI